MFGMMTGFGVFAVLIFWLQGALQVGPSKAAAISTAFGVAFLFGRLALGAVYDHLGSRRFAKSLTALNVTLHLLLAVQQAVDGGVHDPTTEAMYTTPLLVCVLICNAGAVTTWGPLTLDLLGPRAKHAMPLMVTSLSLAQAVGSMLIGTFVAALGPTDAILPFVSIAGGCNLLGGALLWRMLSQQARDAAKHAPSRRKAESDSPIAAEGTLPSPPALPPSSHGRLAHADDATVHATPPTSSTIGMALAPGLSRSDDPCFQDHDQK